MSFLPCAQSGPMVVLSSAEMQDEISDTSPYLKECGVQERTKVAKRCGWGKASSDVTHCSPAKNTSCSSGLLSFRPAFHHPLVPLPTAEVAGGPTSCHRAQKPFCAEEVANREGVADGSVRPAAHWDKPSLP